MWSCIPAVLKLALSGQSVSLVSAYIITFISKIADPGVVFVYFNLPLEAFDDIDAAIDSR